jgi:hypothetical protein
VLPHPDEEYASGNNKAEAFDILGEALYLNRRSRYVVGYNNN